MAPSHVPPTLLVTNLRLALDVQVSSRKQRTCGYAKAAPTQPLEELGDKPPRALARGESGSGN